MVESRKTVQVFEANMQRVKNFLPELVAIMLSIELMLENRMKQRLLVAAFSSLSFIIAKLSFTMA